MIAIESTYPFAEIVAVGLELVHAVEVSVTVPEKATAVLPYTSFAVTRELNGVPATLATAESAVVPPVIVTANSDVAPAETVTDNRSEPLEDRVPSVTEMVADSAA